MTDLANYLREIAPKCSAFSAACPESIRRAADIVEAAEELVAADDAVDTDRFIASLNELYHAVKDEPSKAGA